MPKLTIDGREVEVAKGTTIIQAARTLGIEIPHYCWHPGLTVAGNCRICLVEVEKWPTLQIACNTQCGDGMVVHTQSDKAKGGRSDVMELLLINHPLDCPICDQAGECKLQEYSFRIGNDRSHFDFPKVHKPKHVRFSSKVMFDAERCILCTRCVRFLEEVAGSDELDIVNRGDRNEIAVKRGGEIASPYQMNIVDVCPVGALTSMDFRFKSRVWFLERTKTVCASCSRGCNVVVGARWNRILRLVPRENQAVNRWWMCDDGRLAYGHVAADDRLGAPMVRKGGKLVEVSWDEALDAAAKGLKAAQGPRLALISARLTNEEIWQAQRLCDGLGVTVREFRPRSWGKDDLLRTGDGNPNSEGARILGVAAREGRPGLGDVAGRPFSAALLCGEDLDDSPDVLAELAKVPFVVVVDSRETETVRRAAHVVLPGLTPYEKDGTFTNVAGRVQVLRPCVSAPGDAWPDWRILGALRALADPSVEGQPRPRSAAEVFERMASEVPAFAGLTHRKLGEQGADVARAPAAAGGGA